MFNGLRDIDGVTMVAVIKTHAKGQAAIPIDAQAQDDLLELVSTILTIAIGGSGALVLTLAILISPVERNCRGILMNPGRFDLVCFQSTQGNGTEDLT